MGKPLLVSCIGRPNNFLTRKKGHLFLTFCHQFYLSTHQIVLILATLNLSFQFHYMFCGDVGWTYALIVRPCLNVLFAISGILIRSRVSGSIDPNLFNVNYSNNFTNRQPSCRIKRQSFQFRLVVKL